jgi:ATP-independent RNA helicase DbpA
MNNTTAFSSLPLREELLNNLDFLGYSSMMPVQAQSLVHILNYEDLIAQAKTGSGKTAAFGFGLLNRLNIESYIIQSLVLCPTRELAEQLCKALRQFARLMPNIKILNLSGGMPIKIQLDSLKHSPHIIVGTPGRVLKHLEKMTISLDKVQTLVLDEADRMLDMGFFEAIDEIIKYCPRKRQTLLFSATYPDEIQELSRKFMRDPKIVVVKDDVEQLDIQQIFYDARNKKNKFSVLKDILLHYQPSSSIIFCNTKEQTTQLCDDLTNEGFSAIALNGDMEQVERDVAIIRFKNQSCSILVATDVAARGLDIKDLPAVINFDLAFDHEVHIHRIGRTGRAGSKGLAISLTTPADVDRIELIEDGLMGNMVWGDVSELEADNTRPTYPEMVTLRLNIGRKDKIRPGDILGALTKDAGIAGDLIGKIDITPLYSYVAIHNKEASAAIKYFSNGKVKGSKVHVKRLS